MFANPRQDSRRGAHGRVDRKPFHPREWFRPSARGNYIGDRSRNNIDNLDSAIAISYPGFRVIDGYDAIGAQVSEIKVC